MYFLSPTPVYIYIRGGSLAFTAVLEFVVSLEGKVFTYLMALNAKRTRVWIRNARTAYVTLFEVKLAFSQIICVSPKEKLHCKDACWHFIDG